MNYDVLEYGRQIDGIKKKNIAEKSWRSGNEKLCRYKKDDRLIPVHTVCFYHGMDDWDGPRTLADMLKGEGISDVYTLHLVCLNDLHDLKAFHTPVRQLIEVLQVRRDKTRLRETLKKKCYRRLDEETWEVLAVIIGNDEMIACKQNYKKDGGYDMCEAFQEICRDEKAAGRKEGRKAGRKEGISQGEKMLAKLMECLFRDDRIEEAKRAVTNKALRKRLYEEYQLSTFS